VHFLTEHHAMKAYWGSEIQLHSFFDLDTRWRWVVSIILRPLYYWGKSPGNPLGRRRQSGPQSQSARGGKEKNDCSCRESNSRSSDP